MRPIMLVGTGSDVGKSWIATGICRWLKNQGYQPAPFKAQNMSLNSYATPDGKEIGRAQAVQAEACGIACRVEMNPVLLKPTGESKSQVVLNGIAIGDQSAREYFLGENRKHLFEEVKKAFHQLNAEFNPIVMEGAGSISELNLKHRDIVNMRMAQAANACVYLVADIDKGGVFGSVYGTIELLEAWEKRLLKGIIINKFRGDATLFEEGKKKLEEITGYPVLGVLPYAKGIFIEEEDSVALNQRSTGIVEGLLNVAVLHFHYLSNYTDFQALEQNESIHVFYTREGHLLDQADVIILPGTKNTLEDLRALHEEGLAEVIKKCYQRKPVLGICGGFQMMGEVVKDPYGVESGLKEVAGLGLFPISTTLAKEKKTIQCNFQFKKYNATSVGYEIHMGVTEMPNDKPLNWVDGRPEGYDDGALSWGSYMHGIFDNVEVVNELLDLKFEGRKSEDYQGQKEVNYNLLADHISAHLDMDQLLKDITQ